VQYTIGKRNPGEYFKRTMEKSYFSKAITVNEVSIASISETNAINQSLSLLGSKQYNGLSLISPTSLNQFTVSDVLLIHIVFRLPRHTFLFYALPSRWVKWAGERAYLLFSHPLYTPLIPSDSGVHLEHIPNSASLSPLFPLHIPHHLHPLHQGGFSSVMGIHLSCSWHGMRSAPSQISRNTVLLW